MSGATKRRAVAICLAGLACLGAWVLLRPKPPVFAELPTPIRMPVTFRDRVCGVIPTGPGWGWAWRLEQNLFGKRQTINISTRILKLGDPMTSVGKLLPAQPNFETSGGLQVWLLAKDQLDALRQGLEHDSWNVLLGSQRVATADGITASIARGSELAFSTNDFVGVRLSCLAVRRKHATDLTYTCTVSELHENTNGTSSFASSLAPLVRTNLHAAFRAQIPKNSGLFLLQRQAGKASSGAVGMLMDAL